MIGVYDVLRNQGHGVAVFSIVPLPTGSWHILISQLPNLAFVLQPVAFPLSALQVTPGLFWLR